MKACGFSGELLSAWVDGEAGGRARDVERHLERCDECREDVAGWRRSGEKIASLVDTGVGVIEPLAALASIRARIATAERRPPLARLSAWWQDVWAFRRRAVAGVALAMAIGALSAPLVVLWAGKQAGGASSQGAVSFAGVIIESMEWGGGSQAVIYQGSGTTTLIWVEPDATKPAKDPVER